MITIFTTSTNQNFKKAVLVSFSFFLFTINALAQQIDAAKMNTSEVFKQNYLAKHKAKNTTNTNILANAPVNTGMGGCAMLSNRVYLDRNDNGIFDAADYTYQWSQKVTLYADANGDNMADGAAIATATTDAEGLYCFTHLKEGKYFVQLEDIMWDVFSSDVYGGSADNDIDEDSNLQTKAGNSAKGSTITITYNGEPTTDGNDALENGTYDFGMWKGNGLGDLVWLDNNKNGMQDAGEPGIEGVVVELRDVNNNAVQYATTDAKGYYFFGDLNAGTYSLYYNTPAGYKPTSAKMGTDEKMDSDPINGTISNIIVENGFFKKQYDAGFIINILPLDFTSLKITQNTKGVTLGWTTLSEGREEAFVIMHSTDGIDFTEIGTSTGKSNSNTRLDYAFNHRSAATGINYYRLKMLNGNGKMVYSNIVSIVVANKGNIVTNIYPNPFVDQITVTINADAKSVATILMYDNGGKTVVNNSHPLTKGTNTIAIDNLGKLTQGMYILKISIGGTTSFVQKIVK
jgi:SdrD B-like domain/Secretion system C-terminal sorting domain